MRNKSLTLAGRLRDAITVRVIAMTSARREAGMSTLEMLVLGGVILTGAGAFVLAWSGALDSLISDFKTAVGK